MNNNYSKRINEPTPNGGVYSIAYFFDENRKPCIEDKAKFIDIIEYDKDDIPISRTYCICD